MEWEKAETANVDPKAHYLVRTNGDLWSDFNLMVMPGAMVTHRLEPQIVRGRPVWIAKITNPEQ